MVRTLNIAFLFFICLNFSAGQIKVLHFSQIPSGLPVRCIPDIDGNVLVCGDVLTAGGFLPVDDGLPVLPGWPKNLEGGNERGGTYCNLDDDQELEILYPVGTVLYAFNIDGTDVQGWPRPLDYPPDGTASFGDIDGDGYGEIVVTTRQTGSSAFGKIYAFETDGNDVAGFPVETEEGGAVRTPVLADLNGDGALEIIVTIRYYDITPPGTLQGFVYVIKGDGTMYPGWPQRMDYAPGSTVAVGDIDGDEIPEIIAESFYSLHAYTPDGFLLEGFPYSPGPERRFSYSTPVLADLDGDGNREIICGDHSIGDGSGAMHVVKNSGEALEGWPKYTDNWVYGPPSVGDINEDGLLDIVVGDQGLATDPIFKVYGWTGMTGDTLDGFPVTGIFGVNSQIILADIDGDDHVELMFDDNTSEGKYMGYNHDGTEMEGWPLPVEGSTFYINPLVADLNRDGMMLISGGGSTEGNSNTNVFIWEAGVEFNSQLALLPLLQYNTRHNGVYGDTLMVGVRDITSSGEERWKLAPNPAKEKITFYPPGNMSSQFKIYNLKFTIYNVAGTIILKNETNPGENPITFDISGFPAGVYFLQITDHEGVFQDVIKFIKF